MPTIEERQSVVWGQGADGRWVALLPGGMRLHTVTEIGLLSAVACTCRRLGIHYRFVRAEHLGEHSSQEPQ